MEQSCRGHGVHHQHPGLGERSRTVRGQAPRVTCHPTALNRPRLVPLSTRRAGLRALNPGSARGAASVNGRGGGPPTPGQRRALVSPLCGRCTRLRRQGAGVGGGGHTGCSASTPLPRAQGRWEATVRRRVSTCPWVPARWRGGTCFIGHGPRSRVWRQGRGPEGRRGGVGAARSLGGRGAPQQGRGGERRGVSGE